MMSPYRQRGVWAIWLALTALSLFLAFFYEQSPTIRDYPPDSELQTQGLLRPTILGHLNKWEGYNLWFLIEKGYADYPTLAVKFPLYPFLAQTTRTLLGIEISLALFLWHKLALLVAIAEVWRFWQREYGFGNRAVLWLIAPLGLTPLVYFYHYDEPLYLALFWFALNAWREGQYKQMVFSLCALVLTRPSGIFLAVLLSAYALWDYVRHSPTKPHALHLFWYAPLATFGLWAWQISLITNQFFAPFTAQALWGRTDWVPFWTRIEQMFSYYLNGGAFNFIAWRTTHDQVWVVLIALPLIVWAMWRQRKTWLTIVGIYTLLAVLIPFATLTNVARLSLVTLVPFAVLLAPARWQPTIQRFEPVLWVLGWAVGIFLTLMAGTVYNQTWGLLYSP